MNLQIKDGYKYSNEEIIKLTTNLWCAGELSQKRSINSYVHEWAAHKWLYNHHLWTARTKDVDLNSDENILFRIGYCIIYFLFK